MFRCKVCRKRTEDIDASPCGEKANHQFDPEPIRTMHKFNYDKRLGTVTVLCTGEPPRNGATGLGGNYGITCIRCRTKMKEQLIASLAPISSFQEDGVPGDDLAQPNNPDTLSAEIDNLKPPSI